MTEPTATDPALFDLPPTPTPTAGQAELTAQAEVLEGKAAEAHKRSLELAKAARALRRASDSLAV